MEAGERGGREKQAPHSVTSRNRKCHQLNLITSKHKDGRLPSLMLYFRSRSDEPRNVGMPWALLDTWRELAPGSWLMTQPCPSGPLGGVNRQMEDLSVSHQGSSWEWQLQESLTFLLGSLGESAHGER